jgi:tRNA dimethylallyltransferase
MEKYYIKTYGCQMNESDSEHIASFLEKKGYKSTKDMNGANLIVVNACSVRQSAIDRIFGLKQKFKKLRIMNPELRTILTGCVLKPDKKKFEKFFDEVLTIEEFLDKDYLCLEAKHLCSDSVFVPIMTGCDNYCTYCVVPYTRGQEKSRPMKEVVEEAKDLIKKGYKKITLLGQNVNSYKHGFVQLLQKLNGIPGNFKIYFLTNHPKDMSDELINIVADCKKIAKEIHLPIQSGDDKILKKMNRGYTVRQYKNLVKKIREKIPNVKISTDVIVGFPGETEEQFQNTVKLFKEANYDMAYINKYSPRLGTAAYELKDNVSWEEKKRRWNVLNEIANTPQKNKLIVILGSTALGKSELAVKLAKKFNGEIISADSRQVYKGMDIGTSKITKKEMQGIPHHLLDIASPQRQFTVAQYQKKALKAIKKIYKKGKIPILCGGTGFYIQAVVDGLVIPKVKPDQKLRKKLEKETTEALFKKLKKLDPRRAKIIDFKNRRRLIRALEIIIKTGKSVPKLKKEPSFKVFYIGIKKPLPELKKAINKRVDRMIKQGLEKEVKELVKKHGWTIVIKNAIGYSSFAKATEDRQEIIDEIKLHTLQFAKRQITWFKRDKRIHWIENYKKAEKLVRRFLKK